MEPENEVSGDEEISCTNEDYNSWKNWMTRIVTKLFNTNITAECDNQPFPSVHCILAIFWRNVRQAGEEIWNSNKAN